MKDELVRIERTLWTGGPSAYEAHVDAQCLLAFTAQAGVSTREEVARAVADGPRWSDLRMDVVGLLEPTPDVAVLTYRASARRGDDAPYRALVTSGYVRRDDGWKLMFHQQTPLGD